MTKFWRGWKPPFLGLPRPGVLKFEFRRVDFLGPQKSWRDLKLKILYGKYRSNLPLRQILTMKCVLIKNGFYAIKIGCISLYYYYITDAFELLFLHRYYDKITLYKTRQISLESSALINLLKKGRMVSIRCIHFNWGIPVSFDSFLWCLEINSKYTNWKTFEDSY